MWIGKKNYDKGIGLGTIVAKRFDSCDMEQECKLCISFSPGPWVLFVIRQRYPV